MNIYDAAASAWDTCLNVVSIMIILVAATFVVYALYIVINAIPLVGIIIAILLLTWVTSFIYYLIKDQNNDD